MKYLKNQPNQLEKENSQKNMLIPISFARNTSGEIPFIKQENQNFPQNNAANLNTYYNFQNPHINPFIKPEMNLFVLQQPNVNFTNNHNNIWNFQQQYQNQFYNLVQTNLPQVPYSMNLHINQNSPFIFHNDQKNQAFLRTFPFNNLKNM